MAATSVPADSQAQPASKHVVYIDWLKFLVVYGILVYHAALPFSNGAGWLVSSRDRSLVLTAFTAFTFPWGIPLLFLLSGSGAYFGLRSKTAAGFLRKRIIRLGLPLVAGIVLLSPLQAYLTSGIAPKNLPGMLGYYPQFLSGVQFEWTPQWLGRYGYHLWFLGYLLAITALSLPLLEWLRGDGGRHWIARLAAFSRRRGGILVFAVPLVLSQLVLRNRFPRYQDWADVATYTLVFLSGYVLAVDARFTTAIRRNAGLMVKLGVVSSIGVGSMLALSSGHPRVTEPIGIAYYATYSVLWSLNIWCWCVSVLALGIRWLNRSNSVVRYASESALPFYVIHHPVVVFLASVMVGWSLPLWIRFLLVVVAGFAVTLSIYDVGVRRTNATRFIFGLGPLPHRTAPDHEPATRAAGTT